MQQHLNSPPKKSFKDNNKRGNSHSEKYEHRQPPSKKCMITKLVKIQFLFLWKEESTIF